MPIAIDHIKHFDVVHILRRDVIPKWNQSRVKLKYGELALGYADSSDGEDGVLVEIRAGKSSENAYWENTKTFIPAFPIIGETPESVINNRKNKILGFDEHGRAVLLAQAPGALYTLVKRNGPEGQNDGLYLESIENGYKLGINNEDWMILSSGAQFN